MVLMSDLFLDGGMPHRVDNHSLRSWWGDEAPTNLELLSVAQALAPNIRQCLKYQAVPHLPSNAHNYQAMPQLLDYAQLLDDATTTRQCPNYQVMAQLLGNVPTIRQCTNY